MLTHLSFELDLRREDPRKFFHLQGSLKTLLSKGLPADEFWNLFIQCTDCKYVMPQQYFPYYHACAGEVAPPPRIPSPRLPDLPPSDDDHEGQVSETEGGEDAGCDSESESASFIDIDGKIIPVDLSSDDPIFEMPVIQACALLAQREAIGTKAEPVTPKPQRTRGHL